MPSPFPGMDPYLENPHTWPNLHLNLIASIQATLNDSLGPKYVANVEDRIYISGPDDPGRSVIAPDIRLTELENEGPLLSESGGAATLVETEPLVTVTLLDEEIHEHRLKIIDVASRTTVTVIEVLSPTNKHPGAGRESYLEKQQEVLSSRTHFVEIDLLRRGQRTYSYPRSRRHHYGVHVSEHGMRPRGKLWLLTLKNRLPVIAVPLKKKDGDVKIDLQAAFAEAYRRGGYGKTIDYSKPPVPPLAGEWDAWARSVIARA